MAPFIKNKFINDYYIRYYTSHRVVIRGAINGFIPPGVHVSFNNTDFIVFESNINITQSSDTILTLARPL